MPKSLNDILKGVKKSTTTALTTGNVPGVDYADKMKDGRDFVAQHSIEKHADRVGNDDTVYKGSTKKAEMKRHGHEPKPKDIRVYNKTNQVTNEEVEGLEEADLMHIKVGEKVRLTNPKATPKHTVDKIKGDKVHITRDNGSKVVMPLNRIKRVKAQAMKLKEDKDEREYGYEGDMAITQLKTICRHSEHLMKMLKPDTDLPEWVQSKITKAEDYISTAHDYLMSEMSEEVEQIDELTGKKKKPFGKDPLSAVANRAINRMKLPPNDGSKLSPEEVRRNQLYGKVSRMAFDRMEEEVEELDEGGSQYRSAAGSGKNTNPNLSKLARKLAFEKPKYFRPPGEKSKAENREILDSEIAKFMKKGGKIRKEEVEELDEAKCNMSEANKMCEVHGMKACPKEGDESASDMEPRRTGKKDKPGVKKLLTDKKISESISDQRSSRKTAAENAREKIHGALMKAKMKEQAAPVETPITFPASNSREGFRV